MKRCYRPIITRKETTRTVGTVKLGLSCGHEVKRKLGDRRVENAHCPICFNEGLRTDDAV